MARCLEVLSSRTFFISQRSCAGEVNTGWPCTDRESLKAQAVSAHQLQKALKLWALKSRKTGLELSRPEIRRVSLIICTAQVVGRL